MHIIYLAGNSLNNESWVEKIKENFNSFSPGDILYHLKPDEIKSFIKNYFFATKRMFIIYEPRKKENTGSGLIYSLTRFIMVLRLFPHQLKERQKIWDKILLQCFLKIQNEKICFSNSPGF